MKKVLLSLAAVAVLASCVKENISEPVQNAGKYTIKAAAQISKTTLAGTTVEWEATDEIAVVLDGDNPVMAKFAAVEATLNGSKADFTGDFNLDGDLKFSDYNCAYAVNPSSAVDFANKKIVHTLAADQTEGVKSGDLLSTAPISLEALPKGEAEARFSNALTLLQVVVPEGVQKVEFTADMYSSLVGTAEFSVDAATGTLAVSKPSSSRKVTLEAAAGLEAKTYPVLVYPGKVKELTLHMVGLDGAEYTNTVADLEFVAGEYRTINLCNIFGIYSEDTLYATPAGGNVLVPVVSAVDHEFTVTTDASWITYVETKGFHGTEIVLNVEANTTGAAREASVTVKWGEDAKDSRTYKVSQEALYDHFLNVEWEESFGLYSSESDAKNETNAVVTYKNVFTIELSDDFSKGMYKVNGMLVENNSYNGKAGATYYANYNDGQLIVLKNDKGYAFNDKEVAFTYNEAEKTFTAAPIKFGYKFDNADMRNGGYIGGYKAVVKVEEPEEPEVDNGALDAFVGTWSETYVNKPYSWSPEKIFNGEFTVSVVDGRLYFENIFVASYGAGKYWGTLSADGATIELEDAEEYGHPEFGPLSYNGPVTLVVGDGTLTVATAFNGAVASYVATKKVNPLLAFVGTWSETYVNKPYSWSPEKIFNGEFTVSVVDGRLYFENIFVASYGAGKYWGTLSADGATIELEDAEEYGHPEFGPLSYNGPVTLVVGDGTLTVATAFNGAVESYVATKQGAVEPEPEPEPVAPAIDFAGLDWASAAVAVNDESATSDFKMKEIRAFIDEKYLYVRLATAQGLPLEANYLDVDFSDGDGPTKSWEWATTGTNNYWAEHLGPIDADGTLTGMSFGGAEVICHTEVADESVTWYLAYPRESVEKYISAKGKIYVSALLWNDWNDYWAVPARGEQMLKVDVFEDPNSLKNADWNAENVATYVLDEFMYESYPQYCALTELKAFADETNIYARLKSTTTSGAARLRFCTADTGEGSQSVWYWEKSTYATATYKSDKAKIGADFNFSLSYNGTAVGLETVVEGTDVYWYMTIPRSAHDHTKNAGSVNIGFLTYDAADKENGFMPKVWGEMLKVTLP